MAAARKRSRRAGRSSSAAQKEGREEIEKVRNQLNHLPLIALIINIVCVEEDEGRRDKEEKHTFKDNWSDYSIVKIETL